MTTAFVTGVNGQDGTYLVRRLVGEGVVVHGMVTPHEDTDPLAHGLPAEVALHRCDLRDAKNLAELVAHVVPDELYNLGGISSVAFSWDQPVLTGLISGLGAVALFEAARRVQDRTGLPVRVVQASSAEMFGVPDRTPQDEGTPLRPVSPYGAAKTYAHVMAAVYRARGVHVATCVFYNHESPLRPETFVTRKITAGAARIAAAGGGTLAMGNLDARRDWGWAPDYVDALVAAARHDTAEDFVIATGKSHSVAEFVAAAFARVGILDWRPYVIVDPQFFRPIDPGEMVGNASKARRLLGWAPTVTFEEMVGRMVDHDVALIEGAR